MLSLTKKKLYVINLKTILCKKNIVKIVCFV